MRTKPTTPPPSSESSSILLDYINEIKTIPLLTKEEEKALGRKIQKGNKAAVKKMVSSNLRFVVSIITDVLNISDLKTETIPINQSEKL